MKKLVYIILAIVLVFSLSGCYDTYIKAPPGKLIKISSKPFVVEDKSKFMLYALWGLYPLTQITPNDTVSILQDVKDGSEVTIRTERTVLDWVISMVGSYVTVYSKSVEVDVQ